MTEIPKTMRAVLLRGLGGLDKLDYVEDWPTPVPTDHEVLVNIHACGLNNTDINTRTGWYSKGVTENTVGEALDSANDEDSAWGGTPLEFPRIQGADVAGTVVAVGAQADAGLLGKLVMIDTWLRDWDDPHNLEKMHFFGSEVNGGYADYAAVDYRNVYAVDSSLSHAEIATFATSYVTAENMLNRASVDKDDTVLVTGASGGVGSALIQLAKRRGAKVVAMCSPNKQKALEPLSVDAVIGRDVEDLPGLLSTVIGESKVSVVADVVGGPIWPQLIDVLHRGGRYTCAGAIAGPIVPLDLRTLYLNDLTFVGATAVPVGVFADLVSYIAKQEVQPLLAHTFELKDLHKAQEKFVEKNHVGNIVVTM